MGQYTDALAQFLQYGFNVLPEVHRQGSFTNIQKLCISQAQEPASEGPDAVIPRRPDTAELCNSFFALYPGVDLKSTLTFTHSLYSLSNTLETYHLKMGITDEVNIHKLYSCLSGAVDPSRSTSCILKNLSTSAVSQIEVKSLPCMSDQCRLQLAVLPSFPLVAAKLKKYIQYYIDLQSYKHYPANIRNEYIETWSDNYLKRYQEISQWEFCAAADSLFGIVAMYTSAVNPHLTAADVQLLDEACFPWLCGLESLLRAYIGARVSNCAEQLNFTSFYKNLKDCEERLLFFASKAEEACMKLKDSGFYLLMIKIMIGMYLTDPKASFGMYRIASSNLLKKGSFQTIFYSNACKLLRLFNLV